MNRDICEKLESLLESSQSFIVCETLEEERLRSLVRFAASNIAVTFFEWSVVSGLRPSGKDEEINSNDPIECLKFIRNYPSPAVFLLKDFATHLQNPTIVRLFREVIASLVNPKTSVLLCSPQMSLSSELAHLAVPFELNLPGKSELRALLNAVVEVLSATQKIQVKISAEETDALISSLSGLTLRQARQILTYAITLDGALTAQDIDIVLARKADLIQSSGLLEIFPISNSKFEIGGFAVLKDWLKTAAVGFSEEARQMNIPAPKGILLVGIPGCGKSLCAKVIASTWRQALVKLDASRLFDKYIGETEKNFRKATAIVEAMAPCVFWIDEIEKIMSAGGDSSSDGGASNRALGMFLTWMQEKQTDVFLVATANDISRLPTEFLRKGRFDEIFFVDLPSLKERTEILEIQIKWHKLKAGILSIDELAKATENFSGAELEQFLTSSLLKCLRDKRPLTTELLLLEAKKFIPLAQSRFEEINKMRAFAKTRFLSVS